MSILFNDFGGIERKKSIVDRVAHSNVYVRIYKKNNEGKKRIQPCIVYVICPTPQSRFRQNERTRMQR